MGGLKLAFVRLARPELLVMNDEIFDQLKIPKNSRASNSASSGNGVDTGRYTPPRYNEKINEDGHRAGKMPRSSFCQGACRRKS